VRMITRARWICRTVASASVVVWASASRSACGESTYCPTMNAPSSVRRSLKTGQVADIQTTYFHLETDLEIIGVIYGGTRVPVPPLFGLGYRTPTFQDEKLKNLLASAVNRGHQRTLNYDNTVSRTREVIHPSYSPPLLSRDQKAPLSLSELVVWYPSFRPKLRPFFRSTDVL